MFWTVRRILLPIALLALIAGAAHAAGDLTMRFIDDIADGDYDVSCTIVLEGKGELRVGFDATESGDVSWFSVANGQASLHRLSAGVETRVGKNVRVNTKGPALFTLQRRADRVCAIIGDQVTLDVPWDGPAGGQVGVSSDGRYIAGKPSIQPVDPPFVTDDFTREAAAMGDWRTSGGSFENTMIAAPGAQATMSANPFSLHVEAEDGAFASTGYWFWDSYRVGLSVRPAKAPTVELRAWVQNDANYLALRWQKGHEKLAGARKIVLVRDGVERVLAKAPGGFEPGEWYRLELQVTPGRVVGLIDREPMLTAKTDAFGQGAVGLALTSGDAYFDDLLVAPPDYREGPPRINPVFLADPVMIAEEVFVPSGFWRTGDAAGQYWHWGEFFADARAIIPIEQLAGDGLGVLLRSDGQAADGYRVDLAAADGQLAVGLARNGAAVASESVAMPSEQPVTVEVAGGSIEVSQDGRPLWGHTDPEPLTGHMVALLDAPADVVNTVSVLSDHFQDYVFEKSPTDWFAGKGEWTVTSRWPCSPDWTFYGGAGDENPLTWTKHSYRGDMVLEWFGAIESDNIDRIRYLRPSDINATICGDGQSLSSGYSFIFAGWHNTKAAILRNGEVVAETADVILSDPNARDLSSHRGWLRMRIEKFGNHIGWYYEKKLLLEYTDPNPLPEGRIGLWSFHNEPIAGRVRIWYSDERPPSVVRKPDVRWTQLAPTERPADAPEILDDFEQGIGEWQPRDATTPVLLERDTKVAASGGASLRITNQEDGGPFTVEAVTTPFSIENWPELSFDYRLSPGTRVSLYLLIDRKWHAVALTGEQTAWDKVPVIGEIADASADGQWHHAQIDLLAGLHAVNPSLSNATVSQIVFSPPWESYALCGIGGNAFGTSYWIDNFRIGPAE